MTTVAGRVTVAVGAVVVAICACTAVAIGEAEQAPQPRPPRDAVANGPATGTAVIRGRVLAGDTNRPLRRATITISAPELADQGRNTSTGIDGAYEFTGLPAGRYTIRVRRNGYLDLRYGQTRPLELGTPLQLRDGEVAGRIDFVLPRASVIAGRITDETGDPVEGVPVYAMRTMYWQGRRQLVIANTVARTDDAGGYRLVGLTPGRYVVMARLRETWRERANGVEQVLGYAPTYFPGASALAEAQQVNVGAAQQIVAIDFSLAPGRAATVSGMAFDSSGRPLAGRNVAMTMALTGPGGGSFTSQGFSPVAADGSFSIRDVPPGSYRLTAQTRDGVPEFAAMPITVDGVDLANIALTTSSGWTLSGQFVSDDGAALSGVASRFGVAAQLVEGAPPSVEGLQTPDSGRVRDDWTFRVTGIWGPARVHATVPDGLAVKAVLYDGRDVADTPLELRSGAELSGVRIVLTASPTSVRGQLTDATGAPQTIGTVLVFARDPEKWFEQSRWVRAARPDQQGQYRFDGLPPGDYYAVALDYVEQGQWFDPDYLASLREYVQPFTLGEAETKSIAPKLVTPPF
jgi:protocatechuate 3,4-dioxygenase beta subunit